MVGLRLSISGPRHDASYGRGRISHGGAAMSWGIAIAAIAVVVFMAEVVRQLQVSRAALERIEHHLAMLRYAAADSRNKAAVVVQLAEISRSLDLILAELRWPAEQIRRQEGWERPGTHHFVKAHQGETDSETEARTRAELERKP